MSQAIDDFLFFSWKNRDVNIVFDSDIKYNQNIQSALNALGNEVALRGAVPYKIDLPQEGPDKVGADDFIVGAGRKAREAFSMLPRNSVFLPEIITGAELMQRHIPEPEWIIPGFLPKGLTLLAGKPKIGKSWLVLSLVTSIANGKAALNMYETLAADVLYLALEDVPYRLKQRLEKISENGAVTINERSHFVTELKLVEKEGLLAIEQILNKYPDCKLVIIDTLARIRKARSRKGDTYQEDHETIAALKTIADMRGISVLIVHHVRKAEADDPFDCISGTLGLAGAADTNMVLLRDKMKKGNCVLHIRGRDIEEQALALHFADCRWTVVGDAFEMQINDAQDTILTALRCAKEPLGPTAIAKMTGRQRGSITKILRRMVRDGLIQWDSGKYSAVERKPKKFEGSKR